MESEPAHKSESVPVEATVPRRWKKRQFLLAIVLLFGLFVLFHRQVLPYALYGLDIGEPPERCDAVFVLLGENDIRPFMAAALVKTGYADEVMFAQFHPVGLTRQDRPDHLVYQDIMLKRGVPAEKIRIFDHPATNTFNESKALIGYMDEHPNATVTVLTSSYHTRRTRWTFRTNLGKHFRRLRFVSAPFDDFDADDWWLHMRGFDYVMIEYLKFAGYIVLFGNGLWYIAGVAAALVAVGWWRFKSKRSDVANA